MSPTQQTRLALEMAFTKSAGMDKAAMPVLRAVGRGLNYAAEKTMPTFSRWGKSLFGKGAPKAAPVSAEAIVPHPFAFNHAAGQPAAAPAENLFNRMLSKAKANPKTTTGLAAGAGGLAVGGVGGGLYGNATGQETGAAKTIDAIQGANMLQRLGIAFAPGQLTDAAGRGVGDRVRKLQAGRPPSPFTDYFMGRSVA